MDLSTTQNIELDWRGLKCPAPILNTAKAVRQLQGKQGRLQILADDDAFPLDLKSWCRTTKAEIISIDEIEKGVFQAVISVNTKPKASPPKIPVKNSSRLVAATPVKRLDYRGDMCPKPILQLAKEYRALNGHSSYLEILADDPAFPMDLRSWCKSAGASLHSLTQENEAFRALVSKEELNQSTPPVPDETPTISTSSPNHLAVPSSNASKLSHSSSVGYDTSPTEITLDLSNSTPQKRLKRLSALDMLGLEQTYVSIVADDIQFGSELLSWCTSRKHTLLSFDTNSSTLQAKVQLNPAAEQIDQPISSKQMIPASEILPASNTSIIDDNKCTLLVLHNDFEALMASLMIANGAAAGGMDVTVFFSFWGVNLLRSDKPDPASESAKPNIFQKAFRWMMPKGPNRQQLGKLNFGGFGTKIMKGIMTKHEIMDLEQLIESAVSQEVKFLVCTTSMSIMGLGKRDIAKLPNIEYAGVSSFVDYAKVSGLSLVF